MVFNIYIYGKYEKKHVYMVIYIILYSIYIYIYIYIKCKKQRA